MKRLLLPLLLMLSLLIPHAGFADDDVRPGSQRQVRPQSTDQLGGLVNYSRHLLRNRDYQGAADLLETLYEEHPDNPVIISLLKQCYESLQLYSKLEELMRRQVAANPDAISNYLGYAEALARQGKRQEAKAVYDSAIERIEDHTDVRNQGVLQSMITHGLEDEALTFIDDLRRATGDSTFYALLRGMVLQKQKKYGEAALELYAILEDTLGPGDAAERQIAQMLDFVESSPSVEKVLLERSDLFAVGPAMRLLSTHYLRTGQYEKAFDFTITRDSLDGYKGQTLVGYIRDCNERKLFDQAARMGEYVIRRYRNTPPIAQAYFFYADALSHLGRYSEAVSILDSAGAIMIRDREKADVIYRIGRIYLDGLHDYPQALSYFDSVLAMRSSGPITMLTLASIPYCYLGMGELDQARVHLGKLLSRRLNPDMQEEAEYQLAAILFYQNQFDSCRVALNKLVVDYPRGYYVNDALEMMIAMDEAGNQTGLLGRYASALLYEQRQMIDSTAERLSRVAAANESGLAGMALWKLIEIRMDRADTTAALQQIDQMAVRFPESYYLPYGLKIKADVFLLDPGSREEAGTIYRELLEKHPDYPFASEVREKMRRLESEAGSA